jgi:2-amino-4-hydroxy-6-hydroxymethyldihydropteridine diphosphokinase
VAIALGSNLGDRALHLRDAVAALAPFITSLQLSTFHETEPVGVGEQPLFLNAAAAGLSTLPADDLLRAMRAPRTVDLDLILYGNRRIETPSLTVPHPRFRDRMFVLAPLAEVAGTWIDPVSGHTVEELRRALQKKTSEVI